MIRSAMLTTCLSVLLSFSAVLLALPAQALMPFPGAEESENETSQVIRYRLILSELTNRQGTISGDTERLLSGQLYRTVWELPSGVGLSEVMSSVRDQLEGQRILYQCQSIDCGSSNFWANDVFGSPRLVSRDREQAALVSLVKDGDVNRVTVVYISLRGGRQPRVLVDELLTSDAVTGGAVTVAEFQAALAHSHGWLPGLFSADGQLNSQSAEQFSAVLNDLSEGALDRLHLVLHCYSGSQMAETIRCSDAMVDEFRPLTGARVQLHSAGALTAPPDKSSQTAVRFLFWPGR